MSRYYVVEVGVLGHKGLVGYDVRLHFKDSIKEVNLYDEDVCGFDNLQAAKKYADEYVAEGVMGTYAYIWESEAVNTYDGELVIYYNEKEKGIASLINSLKEIKTQMDIICELQTAEGETLINDLGLTKYPFDKSLDEMSSDVSAYINEILEKTGGVK